MVAASSAASSARRRRWWVGALSSLVVSGAAGSSEEWPKYVCHEAQGMETCSWMAKPAAPAAPAAKKTRTTTTMTIPMKAAVCAEGACLGWTADRDCGAGFYCRDSERYPCPAGRFGASASARNASCDGPCERGYFCPEGSVSQRQEPCGGSNAYCPEGSKAPTRVTAGYYAVGGDDAGTRAAQERCPAGHFCAGGVKILCPAGRYGDAEAETAEACAGACEAGYYCPRGSTAPRASGCGLGATTYCPAGAAKPVPTPRGYVAVDRGSGPRAGFSAVRLCRQGGYCEDDSGVQSWCPAGTYSSETGLLRMRNASACLDCFEGFYCPTEGQTRGDAVPCGDEALFCPARSTAPLKVQQGYYSVHRGTGKEAHAERPCPPGTYCKGGFLYECPAGRYGGLEALVDPRCDGPCAAGFYCAEKRRMDPFGADCGDVSKFCPLGSIAPRTVRQGFYSVGGPNSDANRVAEKRCEPGGWCASGRRTLCPAGTYQPSYGASGPDACVPAPRGYYVPSDGAVLGDAIKCGAPSLICPVEGLKEPQKVRPGYYSTSTSTSTSTMMGVDDHYDHDHDDPLTRTSERVAPPGFFATGGILLQCPAGRYGSQPGLVDVSCSGPCAAGYFCPEPAATRPTMRDCGGFEFVCPDDGLVRPVPILAGYYTAVATEAAALTLTLAGACPAGRWRNLSGVVAATVVEVPSIAHVAPTVVPGAPCVACPAGKYKYATGDALDLCLDCDPFTAEATADRRVCECSGRAGGGVPLTPEETMIFNVSTGACDVIAAARFEEKMAETLALANETAFALKRQYACEPGFWCAADGIRRPCPAGTFGESHRETRPTCSGPCAAGYWCPVASTAATERPCGAVDYYCPAGSGAPSRVAALGEYTLGASSSSSSSSSEMTRVGVAPCPAGEFCVDGRRFQCAAGRYGLAENDASSSSSSYGDAACEGPCERGFYCPEGSDSPRQVACSGPAKICPTGAAEPTLVPDGYYSVHSGADADERASRDPEGRTRDAMLPCTPGSYCAGGERINCPAFRFGWRYFVTTPDCDGGLAPGCYEPPTTAPPRLNDCPAECGGPAFYCPATGRESRPTKVSPGFYTTRGPPTRRVAQAPCPPGTYCSEGQQVDCPAGKHQPLAAATRCERLCPPGASCPPKSSAPAPCANGTYATGAAAFCTPCPARKVPPARPQRCFDDRSCCA